MAYFGLLNLYKPGGMTSRDAVNRIARLTRPAKVGHAGTLDPLADGVLVLCLGRATRLIEYIQRMSKQYRATFQLGCWSETEDTEGEVHPLDDPPRPTLEQIELAVTQFLGRIEQRPPKYSALKVQGRRAHALARSGKQFDLKPRTIEIHELTVVRYEYPELVLNIGCGSGTYVRSLGRDLAEALGTAAAMSALTRTAVGPFDLERAHRLDELDEGNIAAALLPAGLAVTQLPHVVLDQLQQQHVRYGRPIRLEQAASQDELAAVDQDERFLAVIERRGRAFYPSKNFMSEHPS